MDPSTFSTTADRLLEQLADRLDDQIEGDVELNNGILTLTLDQGGQFVVNKHAAMQQIWLSSPRSGAWHFVFDADTGQWRSTRDAARTLGDVLAADLGLSL